MVEKLIYIRRIWAPKADALETSFQGKKVEGITMMHPNPCSCWDDHIISTQPTPDLIIDMLVQPFRGPWTY